MAAVQPKYHIIGAGVAGLQAAQLIRRKYPQAEITVYEAAEHPGNEDFKKSYELIKYLDKKTARPVKIIAGIYKKYFDIMQERGWEVISPKPTIGRFGKLALAVKALLAS